MAIEVYRRLPVLKGDANRIIRDVERRLGTYAYDAAVAAQGDADAELAAQHQHYSRVAARSARDAPGWNDQLTSLGGWETAGAPTVSGNRLYGTTSAGVISAAVRPITFGNSFRFVVPVNHRDGLAANRMHGILVTTSTAATLAAGDMSQSVAVAIDASPTGNRLVFANAFNILDTTWGALPAGNKQLLMGFTWDDVLGLGVFARTYDGTFEKASWIANSDIDSVPWRPTRVGWFSTDNRGSASATGYGPVGFKASSASISPPNGVEVAPVTQFGAYTPPVNPDRTRIITPAAYDSRRAYPLILFAHGGGQDVWHAKDLGDSFVDQGCIVASGDWRGLGNSMYPFGSPESIDRVVDTYLHVIERYHVGPVFLAGYSMGGQTCLQALADGRIPVRGVAIGNPAIDTEWVYSIRSRADVAAFWSQIKVAWGVSSDDHAEWTARTGPYNPMTRPVSDFRGVPIWIASSPGDTVAIEAANTLPFVARVNAAVPGQVTHYVASGDHGDPSAWPAATILAWMAAQF